MLEEQERAAEDKSGPDAFIINLLMGNSYNKCHRVISEQIVWDILKWKGTLSANSLILPHLHQVREV